MYLTENWRLKTQRYIMNGVLNRETKEVTFPPRPVASREVEAYDFDFDDEETSFTEAQAEASAEAH